LLATLDAYAFQFLIVLYNFLGVQDIPREPDPDWTVVERWTEQPGQTYKLVLESKTIGSQCTSNPSLFLVFPATSLSRVNIFIDGKLFLTNSLNEGWQLSEVYFKPSINCRFIENSKVIRHEITSYLRSMTSIKSFPKLKMASFGFHFLNSDLFYIAMLFIALMTLINFLIIIFTKKVKEFYFSAVQDICLVAVAVWFSPGKLMEMSVEFSNELFLSFLILGVVCYGHIAGLLTKLRFSYGLLCSFAVYIISIDSKNTTHLITIFFSVAIIFWLFFIPFRLLALRNKSTDKSILYIQIAFMFAVPFMALYDGVRSKFLFNVFTLLPLSLVLLSVNNFINIIRIISWERIESLLLKHEVFLQTHTIDNLKQKENIYNEMIHDIKSPLSGINFYLQKNSKESEILAIAKNRLSELLLRCEQYLHGNHAKWESAGLVVAVTRQLVVEYEGRANIELMVDESIGLDTTDIFVDLVGYKVVIAELVDNNVKARKDTLLISIQTDSSEENIDGHFIEVVVENRSSQYLGVDTFSRGSGKGLFYLREKVTLWGGLVEIDQSNYLSRVKLLCKSS
jgi:hypothetical protein